MEFGVGQRSVMSEGTENTTESAKLSAVYAIRLCTDLACPCYLSTVHCPASHWVHVDQYLVPVDVELACELDDSRSTTVQWTVHVVHRVSCY